MIDASTIKRLTTQLEIRPKGKSTLMSDFAFARACYNLGRSDQRQADAQLAENFPLSPVVGRAIASEIRKTV